jgi:acyl carrier protein
MPTNLDDGEDWAHQHVILFLGNHIGLDPSSISPTDRLTNLMVDSLDIVEIVMAFEDEFGIDAPDDDIQRIETVQDLIDQVRKWRN